MAKDRRPAPRTQVTIPELDRAIDGLVTARDHALTRFGVGVNAFSLVVASERCRRGLGKDPEEATMWFYGKNAHTAGGRSLSGIFMVTGVRLDMPEGLSLSGAHSLAQGLSTIDDLTLQADRRVTLQSQTGLLPPQRTVYDREEGSLSYSDPTDNSMMIRSTVGGESAGRGVRLLAALSHVTSLVEGADRVHRIGRASHTF